ncbi:MAG: leucine-rich repeat domain-containing protein, partial [Oscillospiraceae bacterium]|nr:leucine-rich repeat domain-containing protein [Oscillospiraceae bacterium]
MKHLKRALSMLLVTLMIVTMLPADMIVTAFAAAKEPAQETVAEATEPELAEGSEIDPEAIIAEPGATVVDGTSLTGQDTDLTIDFWYADVNKISTAEDALAKLGQDSEKNSGYVSGSYRTSTENHYKWNHVNTGLTVAVNKVGTLRYYLESTDEMHKYIVLDQDDYCNYSGNTVWKTIEISTDKVLDLNGHTIDMAYNSNKKNSSDGQTTHAPYHKAVMFEIKKGATLTIIDSARFGVERKYCGGNLSDYEGYYLDGVYYPKQPSNKRGSIKFTAYMVDCHEEDISFYTTRDLFNVNGTLVIYGGDFQAGRQKDQLKKNFSWSRLKSVIGTAVSLGVSVAEYATGISSASAALDDLNESFLTEDIPSGDNGGKDDVHTSTVKQTGAGGTDVTTKDTPKQVGGKNSGTGRAETISEGKESKNQEIADGKRQGTSEGENKANDKKTGKNDKNTKIAEAEKKVVDSIVNKDKISSMVDGAFDLVDGIVGMIGSNERSRVTNCIQGTVAHVGNTGTLVVYDGYFKGYGSTPNTRNAVIEVTKQDTAHPNVEGKYNGGQVYVYGGTFEGYCGANIFNMVRGVYNMEVVQYEKSTTGVVTPKTVILSDQETMGYRQLFYDNEAQYAAYAKYIREHPDEEDTYPVVEPIPVSTRNVVIRGGTFRNYYELMMVALKGENNDGHFTKFPGTSGSMNLGIESYGEDLIRDGRIQISDKYGDGPLVLLDDRVEDGHSSNDGAYHYRLFCGDTELRYKQYLEVFPNNGSLNSSYSFQLQTFFGSQAQDVLSNAWGSDEENIREAVFANTEEFFTFPIDDPDLTSTYYVMPHLTDTDVYGDKLNASEVWYYNTPLDYDGNMVQAPAYGDVLWTAPNNTTNNYGQPGTPYHGLYDHYDREENWYTWTNHNSKTWKERVNHFGWVEKWYKTEYDSLAQDMQWLTYKIYRVDPLTRESISEKGYGTDVPLATVKYGASHDSLKCKLPLMGMATQIQIQAKQNGIEWDGYKQGEMYRIVLEVEEYYAFDYIGSGQFASTLPRAKTVTSVCFRCVSIKELTGGGVGGFTPDYTALQWYNEPQAGAWACVQLVNAKAGQVDFRGDKIFDIYYQWYEVDDNGDPIENADGSLRLFAGTDNVLRDPDADRSLHTPVHFDPGNDGYIYANTLALPTDRSQWKAEDIHMYTYEMCQSRPEMKLYSGNLHLSNNNVWFTNYDKCWIPASMAGKNIRVKAIVENLQWPKNFDQQQVYWSHVIHLEEPKVLQAEVSVTPASGVTYASTTKPATVAISDLQNLEEGEYVTRVSYYFYGSKLEKKGLHATSASQIPTVKFPNDFFDEASDANRCMSNKEYEISATVYTAKTGGGSAVYHYCTTPKEKIAFAVENIGFQLTPKVNSIYLLSDVADGSQNGKLRPFTPYPKDASIVRGYETATTTNRNVAYLGEDGYLYFPGDIGTATISVTGPDGERVSKTIEVYDIIDHFEIKGMVAPTYNQTLPNPDAGTLLPFDANYHVVETYWTMDRGEDHLSASTKAQNYHAYTYYVVVAPDAGYRVDKDASFAINATTADGSVDVTSGTVQHYYYKDYGKDDNGNHVFKYTFKAISGGAEQTINKIYMDFPTQVMEGESVDEWLQNVRYYTNGDDSVMSVENADLFINVDGVERLWTYGNLDLTKTRTFLPGVQTGFQIMLTLPNDLQVWFPTEANAIELYVNGVLTDHVSAITSKGVWAIASESLTVVPYGQPGVEKRVPSMPVYALNGFNLIEEGELVYVEDLLNCGDPRAYIRYVGAEGDAAGLVYYDAEENYLEIPQIFGEPDSRNVKLSFEVCFDYDGDGLPEYVIPETVTKQVLSRGSSGDTFTDRSHNVYAYYPDGSTAYINGYTTPYNWGRDGLILSLPEIEGSFIATVTDASTNKTNYTFTYGADRITGDFYNADAFIIQTVDAMDLQVYPGTTDAYVYLVDEDGNNVPGINLSLDGIHFVQYESLSGLEPDTDYTLYYKQGVNGRVYQKKFHTAAEAYDVYIGHQAVTDRNLGVLERDHWHYDPDTKTLTLKDFSISESGLYLVNSIYRSIIGSKDELTLELLGDNYLTSTNDSLMALVYVRNDLTITGPGNLTLTACNDTYYFNFGLQSLLGDMYLDGSGKLTFINNVVGLAVNATGKKAYYRNGDIDFQTAGGGNSGDLMRDSQIANLSFENQLTTGGHTLTIKNSSGEVIDDYIAYVKTSGHDKNVTFTMSHSYNQRSAKPEYLASGDCTSGAQYYYSCSCGACGTTKFSNGTTTHSLTTHAARDYDCSHDGWDEYHTCDKCGWTDFEEKYHPKDVHTWVEYPEIAPTCTEDGHPAYSECSVCGETTAPIELPLEYRALGHDIVPVAVTAATCTEDGMLAHFQCTRCGELYADVDGAIPVTAEELVQGARGHRWGEAVITEATETDPGFIVRTCLECGAEDREVIAPTGDNAQTCGETAWWKVEDDTLTIMGLGEMESYNGQAKPWDAYADQIRVVRIEEGITVVSHSGFRSMPNLEEVWFAGTVTEVGTASFQGSAKLSKVNFADGTDDLTIGNYAFWGTALEEIILPARLVEIRNYAFNNCSGLQKITFLGDAPTINSNSFRDVTANAYYPSGNATWTAGKRQNYGGTLTWIAYLDFGYCGYESATTALEDVAWFLDAYGVMTISGTGPMMSVPQGAEGKPWSPFLNQITAVYVEDGVTSVGSYAFERCANLQEVGLADTVTQINAASFRYCTALTELGLGSGLRSFSLASFQGCTALETLTLPPSVTGITNMTFGDCTSLTEIRFMGCPTGTIGSTAFKNVVANAYYPVFETGWTDNDNAKQQDYGGTLTWASWNPGPYFKNHPADRTADPGATATFTANAMGLDLTYQWQQKKAGETEWTNVAYYVPKQLKVTATADLNGAQYRCIVTDSDGKTATSNVATLTVNLPDLEITTQPTDYTGPLNSYAYFYVQASGTDLNYCWQILVDGNWINVALSGIDFSDSDTDTLEVLITADLDEALFRCVITDALGNEVISNPASLFVDRTDLEIITQPTDFTGPLDSMASFHVEAAGDGLTYQWQYKSSKDGKWYNASATGYNTDTMSIKVTTARNGMQFRCKVTDAFGQQLITNVVTLRVAEPLAITTQPTDFTGPVGATATFHVAATGTGLTYQWQYKSAKDGKWYNT